MGAESILLVDDEKATRDVLARLIEKERYALTEARSGGEGLTHFRKKHFDLVLLDMVLPDRHGLEVLKEIKKMDPDAVVIIVTAHATLESALTAVREGAYDYISKAFESLDHVRHVIRRGLRHQVLQRKNAELLESLKRANAELARQKRRLKEQVVQKGAKLEALEEKARQMDKLAALGELSAKVVHETRNPIAIMDGFVQLLPEKYADPPFREKFIGTMTRELASLTRITGRLLEFARPREMVFHAIDLNVVLKELLHDLQSELAKQKIELTMEFHDPLPKVWADGGAMRQVFLNLISNAITAVNGDGKLVVSTALRKDTGRAKRSIVAAVADNGSGISRKDMARLFEPFFTTRKGGTGLGLPISRSIVEKHRGSLDVTSVVGKGSTFTVTLPSLEKRIRKVIAERRTAHGKTAHSGH